MWCLSKPNGERSFHATRAGALAAAAGDTGSLVWFDSFDYERHNPGERTTWLQVVTDEQRALGLAHVAQLVDGLRARWIDPWGVTP